MQPWILSAWIRAPRQALQALFLFAFFSFLSFFIIIIIFCFCVSLLSGVFDRSAPWMSFRKKITQKKAAVRSFAPKVLLAASVRCWTRFFKYFLAPLPQARPGGEPGNKVKSCFFRPAGRFRSGLARPISAPLASDDGESTGDRQSRDSPSPSPRGPHGALSRSKKSSQFRGSPLRLRGAEQAT